MFKMILAAAMLSMVSTAALANPATALSLQNTSRYSTAPVANGTTTTSRRRQAVLPILIGIGVIAAVTYLIIDHENDNDRSDSN